MLPKQLVFQLSKHTALQNYYINVQTNQDELFIFYFSHLQDWNYLPQRQNDSSRKLWVSLYIPDTSSVGFSYFAGSPVFNDHC